MSARVARSKVRRGASPSLSEGAVIVVSLASPREKYWGRLLELSAAGVTVRAILLESFDDFVSQVRDGESVRPATLFFPMHRVERIELDAHDGDVTSLAERFESKSGKSLEGVFGRRGART